MSCSDLHLAVAKAPVTPGLRPGYDLYLRPKNEPIVERTYDWWQRSYDWWQRVVGDRKGQISRNKVDGHVQNLKPAIPNRKRSHD